MTVYQSNQNGWMAFKVQSGLGTLATGAGGTVFRQTGGAGGNVTRAATQSQEVRRDGMSSRGRLGTQKTAGQWTGELSLGGFESVLEAVMRDTWDASALAATSADFTSITTGANSIIWNSGNPITKGFRVGDVFRLTGSRNAANNSKNLRITGLSATTITVAETLTVDVVADTGPTLTRPKKLIQFSASTVVKRYFTIDEYDQDIDQSQVMQDFVWGTAKISMSPNGLISIEAGGAGTGQTIAEATGSSPLLTSPNTPTGTALSVVDATIRVNGNDVVDLTAFDVMLDIKPSAPDVFGSGAIKYAPDVFTGSMEISMNLTALRKDLQYLTDFLGETVYSLHALMVENMSEPKNFMSVYVPNFTLGSVNKSALSKAGGPKTQTIAIPAALVGVDTTGSGYDAAMVKFQSTGI